ncbi:MAG: TonB-dependent receptor [Prevotella sp.]|nr:TonB-dependent receptor [Prevotella sp.]
MTRTNRLTLLSLCLLSATTLPAQTEPPADTLMTQDLTGVTVSARRRGTMRISGAENGILIGREELFRAACCNLGESFTTNPSVDVSYSDATTGAKQIRLLGLSGTYVQMLTENIPNFRGGASTYALDYVPGPWMQSIQVSKGASSVRNGYESITGQIDIEYLKPDNDEGITFNLYGNSLSRFEANADGNLHLDSHLSTELLLHYQDDYAHHDQNHDGFMDQPNLRQWNLQNRWKWRGDRYIFHAGVALLRDERDGGQNSHTLSHSAQPANEHQHHPQYFHIGLATDRYEAYMKHAFIINPEHSTNLALMASGSLHQTTADFGLKDYDATERNGYLQLMFEHKFTPQHELSAGLSLNHDYIKATATALSTLYAINYKLTTPGLYAQYTYNLDEKLVLMAGLRADHSNRYGTFVTPRLHLKLTPHPIVSLRLSAGKGYRAVHALPENTYLLASGRELVIDSDLKQEEAWNLGGSASLFIPLGGRTLRLNAEYYHTRFMEQAVIDRDTDPTKILITNLGGGRSYSHTFQVDASYPVVEGLELLAAWRWNDVKTTYGGRLMDKPLTNRYKALLTATYKTPLGLWQADVTLQLNGGGRLPEYAGGSFKAYEQLQAQVTRWFRHFSVYIGGENLTGFRQKTPILSADLPWSTTFDPTLVWGPVHGRLFYAGIRMNFLGRL